MDNPPRLCYNAFVVYGNDIQLFLHPPIREKRGKQDVQAFCFFMEQDFPATGIMNPLPEESGWE